MVNKMRISVSAEGQIIMRGRPSNNRYEKPPHQNRVRRRNGQRTQRLVTENTTSKLMMMTRPNHSNFIQLFYHSTTNCQIPFSLGQTAPSPSPRPTKPATNVQKSIRPANRQRTARAAVHRRLAQSTNLAQRSRLPSRPDQDSLASVRESALNANRPASIFAIPGKMRSVYQLIRVRSPG